MTKEKSVIPSMSEELKDKFWLEMFRLPIPFVPREDDWTGSIESSHEAQCETNKDYKRKPTS